MWKYRNCRLKMKKVLFNRMCKAAAKGLEQQRGKEYGFGSNHPNRETTDLHKLPTDKVEAIGNVHNLDCERLLSTFGHRAVVAKY